MTVLVVGVDAHGRIYSRCALEHPDRMQIVSVVELREIYRQQFVVQHKIDPNSVFCDWQETTAQPEMADVVLICMQGNIHKGPAVAFANLGYHILPEEPLVPTPGDCRIIIDTVKRNNVLLAVTHILCYARYTQRLKSLLDNGVAGDIVGMQHLEPVGYWYQAYSFMRGS